MPLIIPIQQSNNAREVEPSCCCRRSLRLRKTDLGLSLLGVVGWLALPKCPLCLAAYVAMLSGLSLSVGASNAVLATLTIVAAGCFLVGTIRMGSAMRKNWRRHEI